MGENYCLKCKKKQQIENVVEKTAKNGRKMQQGNCKVCNTKVSKFIKKTE